MADPQVNPNALGAPTEGFGQTVSFAFDPRGVTPSLQLAKSMPHGVGMSGETHGTRQNPNEAYKPVPEDKTAALLMKLGQDILAPKIEEQRNKAFVEGIQRAMQGEAVRDMAEQQPWYSRIFGDTPMMEGARAYEVSTKVNKVVAEQQANMEQLKTLNAQDAAKHFAGVIQQNLTGDSSTDAMLSKHMIDAMPGLMKAQAKAYYGYGQKRAMDALSKNVATGADALQQAGQQYSEDYISEDDFKVRKSQFVASIMPPEGINEENYVKVLGANLRSFASKGNFHAINAIRESGGFDALPVDVRDSLEKGVIAEASRHRDKYAFQFSRQIAELRSDAAKLPKGMTPEDIAKRYEAMNATYQKLTGSPVGLFSSDEMANGLTGSLNFLKSEEDAAERRRQVLADRQATADQKAAAQAEQAAAVRHALSNGDVYLAKKYTKATDDEIDTAFVAMAAQAPDAGSALIRSNFNKGGYVNGIIQQGLLTELRQSEGLDMPSDAFKKAVTRYSQMKEGDGGPALAAAYYGEYAPKLERYIRMTAGDPTADVSAFRAAMTKDVAYKPVPLSNKDAAGLVKTVASKLDPMVPRWLGGGMHLRDDAAMALAKFAEQPIEDWRGVPGTTDTEAIQRGIASAVAERKVELVGGYAVGRHGQPKNAPTLRELASSGQVAIPTDNVDSYFEKFLESKNFKGSGSANITQGQKTADGQYTFIGTYFDKSEGTRIIHFTSGEWAAFAGKLALEDTSPKKSMWAPPAHGATIDYSIPGVPMPMPKAPNIYAGDAKWTEYRAKQEADSRRRAAQAQSK